MKTTSIWLLCLLGLASLNQGLSRPQAEDTDQFLSDGEGEGGEDDYEDEDEGPPGKIISKPQSFILDIGGVAFFPCDVQGKEDFFTRIWSKDSPGKERSRLFIGSVRTPITKDNPRITLLQNGTLELRQVNAEDAGTYSCMISVGENQEVAYTLQVKSQAKITKVTPSEDVVTIKKGSSLPLECIASGYPAPSIKWFKNGHVLEDQDPSIQGARYTIVEATTDDNGFYKCSASNSHMEPDERVIEVQVHYPPEVKIDRSIVPTGEGYESELRCTVTGFKRPELKWYKNNEQKPIMSSERIELEQVGTDHILRIHKTQLTDFGDYTCEAKNNEGKSEAIIRLTGRPGTPVRESAKANMDEGTKNPVVTFRTESFAPLEEYELLYKKEGDDSWISVNPAVNHADGKVFTLSHEFTNLQPGVYITKLKAKNSYGWSDLSEEQHFPKEHEDDLTETGPLESFSGASSLTSELRISLALVASLLFARYYC